jgi:hypothetical protein
MKIDSALKVFSEKYDRGAIQSIEDISNDFGLVTQKRTIKGFNIKEGFEDFQDFLSKYAKYKIENMNNPKATSQSLICERVEKNINEELFKENEILYNDLPTFVESYISGVQLLTTKADEIKQSMFESGVDSDSIGDVNNFVDTFIERLDQSFTPAMDRILWASGYNSKMKLSKRTNGVKNKAVFL